MELKAQLYASETYFRESLSDFTEVLGDSLSDTLWRTGLLIVKPDGLAASKLRTICRYLVENHLLVVGSALFSFNPTSAREFWRYQFTLATLDRLAVNDRVLLAGPALLLMLTDARSHDLPTSVRMSLLKGAADLSVQQAGTLRSLLGQPNRLCSMIHCADEPADLIRELGVLLDAPTRRRLLRSIQRQEPSALDRAALEDALRISDEGRLNLDVESARRRMMAATRACDAQTPKQARALETVMSGLDQMGRGGVVAWRRFARALEHLPLQVDPWDIALLGSTFIVLDEPGAAKVLVGPDPEAWRGANR
jgi:hypothetical protein